MGASNSLSSMVFFLLLLLLILHWREKQKQRDRERERGKHDRNSSEDGMLDLPLE